MSVAKIGYRTTLQGQIHLHYKGGEESSYKILYVVDS